MRLKWRVSCTCIHTEIAADTEEDNCGEDEVELEDEEDNKELDSEEDDVDDEADEYLKKLAKKVCACVVLNRQYTCRRN